MASPARFTRHPGTDLPGWIMADVLAMSTLQLSHPVSLLILMETGDAPLHPITKPVRRSRLRAGRAAIRSPVQRSPGSPAPARR